MAFFQQALDFFGRDADGSAEPAISDAPLGDPGAHRVNRNVQFLRRFTHLDRGTLTHFQALSVTYGVTDNYRFTVSHLTC